MTSIRMGLPGVVLGILEAENLQVAPAGPDLTRETSVIADEIQRAFSLESLAESEPVRAVRAMFRSWGVDPSKYRPSSEALARRVVQGKGLYQVSNVVDVGNLGSIQTAWPYGLYDHGKITLPVVFRHGAVGEMYEGIGKRVWRLAGRPVLADASGPFGSPISDSTRTMIEGSTQAVLAVIYAPETSPRESIENALSELGRRLARFAAAKVICSGLCIR